MNLVSYKPAVITYSKFFLLILSNLDDHVICKQRWFYFFPTCIPFISFSSLISLARTYNMVLKKLWGEGTSLPYSWSLWESLEFLTVGYDCSCRFLEDVLYQAEEILYSWFTEILIMSGYWFFSDVYSAPFDMIISFLQQI